MQVKLNYVPDAKLITTRATVIAERLLIMFYDFIDVKCYESDLKYKH